MELSSSPDIKRPLQQTIATHVIPQLLGQKPSRAGLSEHSRTLAQACLLPQTGATLDCARRLLAQGLAMESLYTQAIPEAARLFHDWWEVDEIDFVAVTRGTFQLEELIYALSVDFVMTNRSEHQAGKGCSALLVNTPGSHHSLGLLILSQFFKRHGWQVISSNQFSATDIGTAVRSEWVDVLGLSMSDVHQVAAMKKLINQARRGSSNPHLQVMVGGPLLRFQPDLAALVGADFSSAHADEAQRMAAERVQHMRASQGMTGMGLQT